ncbi:hypothetical protein TGARI_260810B, partial [Toxoplasma gondii ARI]
NFSSIPDEEKKDKFRRVYVLAALGIIAKLKLVTFCWTFVELKRGEQYAAYASSQAVAGLRAPGTLGPDRDLGFNALPAFSSACTPGCNTEACPHKRGDAGVGESLLDGVQGASLLMGGGGLMLPGANAGLGLGGPGSLGIYDQQLPPGVSLEDLERTEYTTRSGRKTHRTAMRPEKS